jgi:predicted outer membrane repeat protein
MKNKFLKYSITFLVILFCIGSVNASNNIFNNINHVNTWNTLKSTSFDKLLSDKSADFNYTVDIKDFNDLKDLFARINDPNSDIKSGSSVLANLLNDTYDFNQDILRLNNTTNVTLTLQSKDAAKTVTFDAHNQNVRGFDVEGGVMNLNNLVLENTISRVGFLVVGHNGSNQGQVNVNNCSFVGNSASSGSAGIELHTSGNTVTNTNFINNKGNLNQSSRNGGAIFVTSENNKIIGCNFTGNSAVKSGGAIYIEPSARSTLIKDSVFDNNQAGISGGAIYIDTYVKGTEILNTTMLSNRADNGAGIFLNGSTNVYLDDSFFSSNVATNSGAGLYISNDDSINMINNEFYNNNANYGSAIFNDKGYFTITGTKFYSNNAVQTGAIYIKDAKEESSLQSYVTGSIFANNVAKSWAGAIYVGGYNNLTVNNNLFDHNTAFRGGAIFNHGRLVVRDASQFIDNIAISQAGAIDNKDPYPGQSLDVGKDTIFRNNLPSDY